MSVEKREKELMHHYASVMAACHDLDMSLQELKELRDYILEYYEKLKFHGSWAELMRSIENE